MPVEEPSATRPGARREAAGALTDLVLGVAAGVLARDLGRAGADPWWRATFWCTGAAALAGAVHHGVLTRRTRLAHVSWRVIGLLLTLAIALLLVATALQTLGRRDAARLAALAPVGPVAYAAAALRGHGGLGVAVSAQSAAMVAVVLAWAVAAARGHRAARLALAGIALSSGAAALRGLVPRRWARAGVDGDAVYHLAQIPGLVVMAHAARIGKG
jgi:hypothetical protein